MNYAMFEQIGAVPSIIREMKKELIGMQFDYTVEKVHTLRSFKLNGIGARGTVEQYDVIQNKLQGNRGFREANNIHKILTKEEIELLLPDKYIEEDYSLWYLNDDEIIRR